jgi:hypothetical protein
MLLRSGSVSLERRTSVNRIMTAHGAYLSFRVGVYRLPTSVRGSGPSLTPARLFDWGCVVQMAQEPGFARTRTGLLITFAASTSPAPSSGQLLRLSHENNVKLRPTDSLPERATPPFARAHDKSSTKNGSQPLKFRAFPRSPGTKCRVMCGSHMPRLNTAQGGVNDKILGNT